MPALALDVSIEAGATFQREFTVTTSTGAFDFTGYTLRAKLRANDGTEAAVFNVSATTNVIIIELTATQTATLPASTAFSHRYDVEAESPTGVVYRIAQGQAVVSAEQTK